MEKRQIFSWKYLPFGYIITTRKLKEWKKESYKITYEEIKNVLGFEIDHSFLSYKKELKDYGYEVGKISMKEKTVIFNKI